MSRKYYKPFDKTVSENKSSLVGFENQVATDKEVDDKPIKEKINTAADLKAKMESQVKRPSNEWRDGKINVLCNMREKPDMGSNVLQVINAGVIVKIAQNPGDFYKVKHGDKVGYIKKDLITKD